MEDDKNSRDLRGKRLKSIENELEKVNQRLSCLYDAKFDGLIDEDGFNVKENEYKAQTIELKTQIKGFGQVTHV